MRVSIEQRLERPRWLVVAVPVGSVVAAFLIAAVVLAATGHDPISTYKQLFQAGFLQQGSLTQTLSMATPLAFTGLAAAAAFRMKLYNIGAEGQMYMGTVLGAGAGLYFGGRGGPSVFVIGAMVIGGAVGGAGWALIPGILRAFFKASEILTSLLLNYVAGLLLTYLIFESESYWRQTTGFNATVFPTGKPLPSSAIWPKWVLGVQGGLTLPLGAFFAVACALVLWVAYRRTRFGFEVQVAGDSERAARYAGVRMRRKVLAVMALSGGIAGIGGASYVGDFSHSLDGDPNGLQKLGYGYTGIVVAALGRYNPFAVVLIAFLLGGLDNAGNTLQGANFPAGLVGVVQGIILFSVLGGELLSRYRVRATGRPKPTAGANRGPAKLEPTNSGPLETSGRPAPEVLA
ncbi:MAG TPA: ABC transporter permease [Acidimicrobiales bacterium]|nr:ABC transporter permease [Acidimicrobiales bacterium]